MKDSEHIKMWEQQEKLFKEVQKKLTEAVMSQGYAPMTDEEKKFLRKFWAIRRLWFLSPKTFRARDKV